MFGAFYYSGQSCISVQRIFAHESLCVSHNTHIHTLMHGSNLRYRYDSFVAKLSKAAGALKSGDPRDESTFIGPMISEGDAKVSLFVCCLLHFYDCSFVIS